MKITDQAIDQLYKEYKNICGGVRNDYFGILYLEQEHKLERRDAINRIAFGNKDYGIDGYYIDEQKRNLYLYQFKYSENPSLFKETFERLKSAGIKRIFGSENQDKNKNDVLLNLDSDLNENQAIIDRVYIIFVFNGSVEEADRSQVLDKLREDLESKKYIIDDYFNRKISFEIIFRSAKLNTKSQSNRTKSNRTFQVHIFDKIETKGPNDEQMIICLVRLYDIYQMYKDMNQRFFERNIRSALPDTKTVNRALNKSFKEIFITSEVDPSIFQFNHNGITFTAEHFDKGSEENVFNVVEPRLLNGAQTITTFSRFIDDYSEHPQFKLNKERVHNLNVMCRVIVKAEQTFITTVTINNNRQNPVEPWNLHANDQIQLELQDYFSRLSTPLFYERQENAFNMTPGEDLDESGILDKKPIELLRLTKTFLVADGDIDKLSDLRKVFEDEKLYQSVFSMKRLDVDSRYIVLCYKIQLRLNRLMRDIHDKGVNKYEYIFSAKNLLWALMCQGILNDKNLESIAEEYGKSMKIPVDFMYIMSNIATTKCRRIITEFIDKDNHSEKIEQGKLGFLRANTTYRECMKIAAKRFKWSEVKLK